MCVCVRVHSQGQICAMGFRGGWEFSFFSTHLVHCLISPSGGSHCFVLVMDLCWDLNVAPCSFGKTPRDLAKCRGLLCPLGYLYGRGRAGLDNPESGNSATLLPETLDQRQASAAT